MYIYTCTCIRVAFRHTCEYSHNVYWQHATYTRIQVHASYIHVHVREYMYMLIFAHAKIRVHTYVHYILHASVLDAHTNLDIDILNIHMYSHVSTYMHLFLIVCWWCRLNHDAPAQHTKPCKRTSTPKQIKTIYISQRIFGSGSRNIP